MNEYIRKIAISFLRLFLICFSAGLFILSISSTSYGRYAVRDHIVLNMVFCGLIIVGIRYFAKLGESKKLFQRRIEISNAAIAGIYFILGIVVLLLCQSKAVASDPARCLLIANQFLEQNFSSLAPGGYLDRCPHQAGIILCYYYVASVLGNNNYLIIQIINLAIFSYALYHILEFGEKKLNVKSYKLGFLFFLFIPLYPFLTYIYGLLPGFSLAIIGISFFMKYEEERKIKYAIISIFMCSLAMIVKVNNIIVLIAIVLCFLCRTANEIYKEKKIEYRKFVFLFLFVLIIAGTSKIPGILIYRMTGMELAEGIPTSSYIVMGLSESADGPGVFNAYTINTYREAEYNTDIANRESVELLERKINTFLHNPKEMVTFLLRKANYLWNNPTFGSETIITKNQSMIVNNPIWELFRNEYFVWGYNQYAQYFHLVVILGVLLYAILKPKKTLTSYLYLIIVLGGFLFHSFWEVYMHYSLPYFLLLFPYAACGLHEAGEYRVETMGKSKLVGATIIILGVGASLFIWKKCTPYEEYLRSIEKEETIEEVVENGIYNLSFKNVNDDMLVQEFYNGRISIYSKNGIDYTLRIMETGNVICYNEQMEVVFNLDDEHSLKYDSFLLEDEVESMWKAEKDEYGNICFLNNSGYYLCYEFEQNSLVLSHEPLENEIKLSILVE